MISSQTLVAILRRLADEVEKADAPPAPEPPAPAPMPPPPPAPPVEPSLTPPPPAVVAPPIEPVQPAPAAPTTPKPVIDLDTIKGIQQAINSMRPPGRPKIDEDGVEGPLMSYILKDFQSEKGIPQTGKADAITIDTLHKIIFGAAKP
jgi:hypothetical protein